MTEDRKESWEGPPAPGEGGLQRLQRHHWKFREWHWGTRREKVLDPHVVRERQGKTCEEMLLGDGGTGRAQGGAGAKKARNQRKRNRAFM